MKKILFFLLCSISLSFGGVWSSLNNSGFTRAYGELDNYSKAQIQEIEDYYNNEIKNVLDELNKAQIKNQELLTTIQELDKEILLQENQINFLLKQESRLLGNQADIESIKE